MGYSPWGCKESDTTEQYTRTHTHTYPPLREAYSESTQSHQRFGSGAWFLLPEMGYDHTLLLLLLSHFSRV